MKKLVILIGIMTMSFIMNAQISMSIQSGMQYQKTTFGYKVGKIQPYLGFGVLSAKLLQTDVDYDGEKSSNEAAVRVIMPNIGVKMDLISKGNLKAGGNIGIYKPFISGKAKENGVEVKEFKEGLKKMKLFGGELGVFAEYYFSEQFSIGGEFGFRFANSKMEPDEDYSYDLNLGLTYSMFSANFYF